MCICLHSHWCRESRAGKWARSCEVSVLDQHGGCVVANPYWLLSANEGVKDLVTSEEAETSSPELDVFGRDDDIEYHYSQWTIGCSWCTSSPVQSGKPVRLYPLSICCGCWWIEVGPGSILRQGLICFVRNVSKQCHFGPLGHCLWMSF